jgi:ribosomal protein S18 acetylase RimI-like enzyme
MIGSFKLKDGRTVIIKHLSKEDYEINNNYEFVHSWLREVSKYLAKEFKKESLDNDKKELYITLSDKISSVFIGAIFKDKIIGSASLKLNPFNEKESHVGNWGIAIHPDFQNHGLGAELLAIIEKLAQQKGLKKLEAEFYDGNKNAEILYLKKMNYNIEGRKKYAGLLNDGNYADKILIGKIIDKSLK